MRACVFFDKKSKLRISQRKSPLIMKNDIIFVCHVHICKEFNIVGASPKNSIKKSEHIFIDVYLSKIFH